MKVGDLVQLSSYGSQRGYNNSLTRIDKGQVGLIIAISSRRRSYPYRIKWTKTIRVEYDRSMHSRREIKYAYR
jgi:hypothetical protein